jgi:phage terminase large subunit
MCFIQEAIKHCLSEPNRLVFWVAPTYNAAKEIGFDEFMRVSQVLKPAIHTIHHTRLKVVFTNGSTLYFKGSDNPDSLRGRGLTLAILDEAAFIKHDVWSKIIRPALSDKHGKALIGSTPNGFNWFKDMYETTSSNWAKYLWPTELNPLISEEELKEVQSQISRDEFLQEYCAKFITKAGRVYDEFTGYNIIEKWSPDRDKYNIYLGMDFGYVNPTAIAFMAVDRATNNKVFQFDEIYANKTQMEDIISLIRTTLKTHNLSQSDIEACYTDPAGNADELSSGLSPVDMMRNQGFNVINRGSRIDPGIALTRSYIKNSLGECRYFVCNNCEQTIKSFNGYQYTVKKDGSIKEEAYKDNQHDHLCDAVRYFFVNKFDHAKYVASEPTINAYTKGIATRKIMKRCTSCKLPFVSSTPAHEPPYICSSCKEKEK